MCFLLFAINSHPEYPLILAANRDEYYKRPTQQAGFWKEHADVLAGRDLLQGGTWLGITKTGRLAALTNYRAPQDKQDKRPSRGHLVSNYLLRTESAKDYLEELTRIDQQYNGFNLIVGTVERLYYYSNKGQQVQTLDKGIFGLSNHLLDTPWPKIQSGKQRFKTLCDNRREPDQEKLFELLSDRVVAVDEILPDTGVGLETERKLSSIFIDGETYGTRSSTVIMVGKQGMIDFKERTFNGHHTPYNEVTKTFSLNLDR